MKFVSLLAPWQDHLEGMAQAFTPYETTDNLRHLPSTALFASDQDALAKDWLWVGQDLSYGMRTAERKLHTHDDRSTV